MEGHDSVTFKRHTPMHSMTNLAKRDEMLNNRVTVAE